MIQQSGLKRNTIDKYYTKIDVVQLCINLIKNNITIDKNDIIIEPSAGNGSFIDEIKKIADNYYFYDIEPENEEIIKQDFLNLSFNNPFNKNIHIIGNPPFGRQSSLAIKFIRKASLIAFSISFILPKSFKKESLKNKIPLNFHLISEIDLPEKSFLINDREIDVPCIFQIWIKKDYNRPINNKEEPLNFSFVKKEENPHISFRRVGVNAGNIDTDIKNKSVQSHYFIKFNNDKSIEDNIRVLNQLKFDFNNTVASKSISKQELIVKFNQFLI